MLNKVLITFLLAALAQLSFAGKVVVYDHQQSMLRTKLAQTRIEALKAKPEYAQMLAQAESLKSDLESLSKEASSKGLTWGDAEKAEHRKKMEYIQADLKLVAQKLQAENSTVMNSIMVEMEPKLKKVLADYIKSEDIDVILRREVAYINKPDADITLKITDKLDKAK